MYDKDPNQKVRAARAGEAIRSADLQKIVALILQTVKGGRGVNIKRVGQSIIVELESGTPIGSGGGGGGIKGYEVDFYDDLPEGESMPRKSFAWVNETNGLYIRNAANNGWICLNRFE